MTVKKRNSSRLRKSLEILPEAKPIKDIFKNKSEGIVIPKSATVNVNPNEKEFVQFFHRVECRTFSDLQTLSLVPKRLDEQEARKAIAADDKEALSMAHQYLLTHRPLSCASKGNPTYKTRLNVNYTGELSNTYSAIRRTYNCNLAKLLLDDGQEGSESNVGLRSFYVGTWIKNLQKAEAANAPIALNVSYFGDITIQRDATLTLWSLTDTVLADDIRIHVGGKLVVDTSYIKIKCASFEGNIA